jgi:predicted dienelactone hydrolase
MKKYIAIAVFFVIAATLLFTGYDWKKPAKNIVLQPQKCGIATVRFYDECRARPLITEIWYPVDETTPAENVSGLWVRCPEARDAPIKNSASKYPLIIMSHGNGGDRMNGAWLAEVLAANGYIVAAMDHHGNTWNNKIAESFIKIWDRPQDVTFVIDQLLQNSHFGASIDTQKIGFIGYSLGGHTGLWIAGGRIGPFEKPPINDIPDDQIPNFVSQEVIDSIDFAPARDSYQDPRVSAMFLMAPALTNLFDMNSLQAIQMPIYIIAAEGDLTAPPDKNAKILAAKMKKAACTLIPGAANHYVFLNEVSRGGRMMLDKSIAIDPPDVDRKQIHTDIARTAVQFFNTHLR